MDGVLKIKLDISLPPYALKNSLNVNSNATLRLSGSTVIYGDLKLNSGATLEFVGEGNQIAIYGDVTINSGARIIGNYTEPTGKLD